MINQAPVVQIRDLSKTYGKTVAVKGLTFEIPKGQVVGFLGPNGAGKSTTMRMLTGYLTPTGGQVRICDIDILQNPVAAQKHMGYLPENNPLYDDMMVLEYLEYIAEVRALEKTERLKKIAIAVERCGLGDVLGKDIGALSKGYRQRIGLAQAILHDPDLLILDEPTTGLDPNQITEIRELIKELGREKTVLMSTHILSEAQTTCSRVMIINDGKLVADDAPEALARMEGGYIFVQLAALPKTMNVAELERVLRNIQGVTSAKIDMQDSIVQILIGFERDDPRPDIFHTIVGQGLVLLEMRRQEASLEDIFRRLTQDA